MTGNTRTARWVPAVIFVWMTGLAGAVDTGLSIHPEGVDAVMPARMPASTGTLFLVYNNFYEANSLVGKTGQDLMPGFHLRVAAVVPIVVHIWGIRVLGGRLISSAALPILYEHLNGPFGRETKSGLDNPEIGVAAIYYSSSTWRGLYGLNVYAPGPRGDKNDLLKLCQHYLAVVPEGSVTWLPHAGRTEWNAKVQYLVNFTDPETGYRIGNELVWDYSGLRKVTRKFTAGVSGNYRLQVGDDRQDGLLRSGTRTRCVAFGPELKYRVGHTSFVLKYQKETLVENKTRGNSLWLQVGVPIRHRE